ncbi:MAG: hypothetical protein R2909_22185 [Gemmatimonadales bacterium]
MPRAEIVPPHPLAPVAGGGKGRWTSALCFALAFMPFAAGHTQVGAADDVFARLEGAWQGEGTLMGRAAGFRMHWELKPGGFAVLSFSNGALEAVALYRRTGEPTGSWMDTRGQQLAIAWTASDSVLVAEWTGGETGRTVYRLLGAAGVEVVDSVRTASGWREFGRARYRR